MAHTNVVNYAQMEGSRRLDAEYYHPRNQALMSQLKQFSDVLPIARSAVLITDMGAFSLYRREYFVESGIPFLRVENIKENYLDLSDTIFISKEYHARLAKSQVCPRDVLLTTKAIIGMSCVVPDNIGECNMSQNLVRIRFKEFFNPYFVSTFLSSKYGKFQSGRLATGNVQLYLNFQNIGEILIPKLSSDFQSGIEFIVKSAENSLQDSKIFYAQAEQHLLSELGLQDWKPARALTFVRSYSQAAKAGRMDAEYFQPKYQEMLDRISSQVKFDRLGRLSIYKKGVEVGSEAYTDSGIPFWRVSNLSKHGLDESNANFVSQDLYESLRQNYEPQQGEILLSKDATPGLAYYLEHPIQGIVSSGILRLTITDSIPPHYLELVLNSLFVQMQIEQDAGGSIIKHWKPSEVRKTLIPRLSNGKENEIAQLVEKSHAARRDAKALLEKAKRAVEIAIEENEERAIEFIG